MQELNEAWAVLRSPARRAAYDEELVRQATPPPSVVARRTLLVDDPSLVTPQPLSAAATADDRDQGGGCGVFLAVTAALLGLVMVIGLVVAWAVSGAPESVVVRTRERYAVGTCVLVVPAESGQSGGVAVEEVPCSGTGARSGRVQAKAKVPLPCPRGTAAVVLVAEQVSLCIAK